MLTKFWLEDLEADGRIFEVWGSVDWIHLRTGTSREFL
jgi:hypothetical protein